METTQRRAPDVVYISDVENEEVEAQEKDLAEDAAEE
jgi:hypothetical protein